MTFVHRGASEGLEDVAARFACQCADGDGGVGRAEGGGADLQDGDVQGIGQDRQAVDIAEFSLVCCHA